MNAGLDEKGGHISYGYNPPTEVKNELTASIFNHPSNNDRIHFYKAENIRIPELEKAIEATVLISDQETKPCGSGIIISYQGKNYLITNHHVAGFNNELKCYYKNLKGEKVSVEIRNLKLRYNSSLALDLDLPRGDVAIYEFTDNAVGAEIKEDSLNAEIKDTFIAAGYPGQFFKETQEMGKPLLSIGSGFVKLKPQPTEYMRKLLEKSGHVENEPNLKVYFTGRTLPGNSGGPLIDEKGKIAGICRGPSRSFGKEDGVEEFIDFRFILIDLIKQAV